MRTLITTLALLAAGLSLAAPADACPTTVTAPQWRFTPAPTPGHDDAPVTGLVGASIPRTTVAAGPLYDPAP